MKKIGIIGGGASGVLAAIQLRKTCSSDVSVVIFDSASQLGRGKAYKTSDEENLLNVPVERMSAYPDDPESFRNFLLERYPLAEKSKHWPFVSRLYFGQYLERELNRKTTVPLRHIPFKVSQVSSNNQKFTVVLENGQSEVLDYLIVATGYQQRLRVPWKNEVQQFRSRIIQASDIEGLEGVEGEIIIIGTGLTGVDVVKRLAKKTSNRFTLLSRRGLLPVRHAKEHGGGSLASVLNLSPLELVKSVRKFHGEGATWPSIADHVRASAQKIWMSWSAPQRSRFLRHARTYWEVIRHRLPPTVADELACLQTEGRLCIYSGRIQKLSEAGARLSVHFLSRQNKMAEVTGDWIVVATGAQISQDLCEKFPKLEKCEHGFGYSNLSSKNLFVLGPASKSMHWEVTAVPDIRIQAQKIAQTIASELLSRVKLDSSPENMEMGIR